MIRNIRPSGEFRNSGFSYASGASSPSSGKFPETVSLSIAFFSNFLSTIVAVMHRLRDPNPNIQQPQPGDYPSHRTVMQHASQPRPRQDELIPVPYSRLPRQHRHEHTQGHT